MVLRVAFVFPLCLRTYEVASRKKTPHIQYIFTYSMEQSHSWEPNRFAASQEIPRILWNPKVHYHNLSQLDPVHTPTSNFLKIHLNIILSSTPGYPHWSLSLMFPHQNPVHASPLPHTRYMPTQSHSFWNIQNIKAKFIVIRMFWSSA